MCPWAHHRKTDINKVVHVNSLKTNIDRSIDLRMEKSKRNLALLIFSAFLLLFPHVIISTAALDQEKQSVSDKFRGLYSVVTSSSMSCWQKLKTLVNDVQLRYFPPSLE